MRMALNCCTATDRPMRWNKKDVSRGSSVAMVRPQPRKVSVLVLRGPKVSRAIAIESSLIERAAYLSSLWVTKIPVASPAVLEVV